MFSICALNYMAQLQISWPAAEKQLKPEISLQCTCVLSILEQILMHQGVCVCTLQLKSYLTEGKMYHLGFSFAFFFWPRWTIYFSLPTSLFPLEIKTVLKDTVC